MDEKEIRTYLDRIHYVGDIRLNRECLDELVSAHQRSVPFENLEIYEEHKVPSLKTEDIYDKIVEKGRGGYCFELNKLFYELLLGLGFSVYPVGIRIVWQKEALPPMLHRGTVVTLDGEKYLCDVGYGGPGPRTLIQLVSGEYKSGDGIFRVTANGEPDIRIDRMHEAKYCPLFRFCDQKAEEADFITMNYYCAKSEHVLFTQRRMVNLCLENGSRALTGQTLTCREGESIQKIEYRTQDELSECLKNYFGIIR